MLRNKKRFKQIKELASQGLTKSQISRRLDIALQTVSHYEQAYGLDIKKDQRQGGIGALSHKPWTEDEEFYLAYAMADPDVVIVEVARELGRSKRSVTNKVKDLKDRGLLPRQAGRLYSDKDLAYLIRYYNKLPLSQLSETLGRSPEAVEAKALRLGLGKPKRVNLAEQIRDLAEKGYYLNQIAQKLQTTHSHILYYEKVHGLVIPRENQEARTERVKKNMQNFFNRRSFHWQVK